MNREFLEHYERELRILYEQARDFSAEYPGIAERLGGLTENAMDPGLAGLLEGAAFLAARVQLKLKSEFSEFTNALLEQLVPNYLAPLASSVLVQASPKFENPNLLKGVNFPAGSYIDAVYVERERRVSCRYQLGADLTLWPLQIERAEYYPTPAPLHALGMNTPPETLAGLRLTLLNRNSSPDRDVAGRPHPGAPMANLAIDRLPIYFNTNAADGSALYEQLFAHCARITLRYETADGDVQFRPLPLDSLQQIGFGDSDALVPGDDRVFAGFDRLREYFAFPAKFRGFVLTNLRMALGRLPVSRVDIIFEMDQATPRLAPLVTASFFALYAVPATNLFELSCSRIPLSRNQHEYQIVPDRSRTLDFEAHRVLDVFAHYPNRKDKVPVLPLYSLPDGGVRAENAVYYTVRRLPRLPTERERRFGSQSSYVGTETFISIVEPAGLDDNERIKEISVRALVSNRHLTEALPVGDSGADFRLSDDMAISLRCLAGPTPPRDSLVHRDRVERDASRPSPIAWRLINFLSFSHLGLVDRPDARAGGLREMLAVFADVSDTLTERQIRGIAGIESRPIVRHLRQANGFNAARGIEITVTLDEKAFEGAGIMILGAALDRFFAEYTSINSFTQTVIASSQRGAVMRWPPRSGLGSVL
ncbi:type VI secretion system baseplate subunit TssF [Devosia sp. Root635]|uniref:type VI secretion system baseplate subunit TssF n=1 Tax=Devosia sp. Root635 TaxID=1736575 RepID=UPI0006F77E1C|nr:type VI secretion system baseplate subunit TssF [Devosia sp. Root635]KRA53080.1 type VI secretion protein [Devosia sp. Root635]